MTLFLQLLLNALVNASIYSLLAVGFGLVYRSTRFFHIAYGAVYVIASYGTISLITNLQFPAWLAIVSGIMLAAFVSILMEKTAYLPLERSGAGSGVLFIASLGINIFLINLIALLFGNELKVVYDSISPSYSFNSLVITKMQIIQFFTGWSVIGAFWIIVRNYNFMKALWAMGETPTLIKVLGLPFNNLRVLAFSISSCFAGIASLLTSADVGITPYMGMQALLTGAVAVIIGGIDLFWGWVAGATLVAILQGLAVWQFSAKWNDLITFALLILTLLFRPQGLFSPKKRREEL
jgi:branched-chain amino acid transport system permease protein